MGEQIKAIETYYNGYKFRSRLEARWAVFFDALGIKYQYETEGYSIDGEMAYLPDFYLPDFSSYVEVKGNNEHLKKDLEKVEKFVRAKKHSVLVLSEIPYDKKSHGVYWFPICYYTSLCGSPTVNSYAMFVSEEGEATFLADDYSPGANKYWHICFPNNDRQYEEIQCIPGSCLEGSERILMAYDLKPIEGALLKARQARFERFDTTYDDIDVDKLPFD